jgi:glycolate oxidase
VTMHIEATAFLAALRAELGNALVTDRSELEPLRRDRSGQVSDGVPLAVVNATTIAHVQSALRLANEYRIPVVPRGAGTGLTGASMAGAGELVLSTAGMTRILEINEEDQLAVVEPGVINGDLNRALEAHGLWFAPDPASKDIASIGGNIATNAGGLLCAKYGVTREAVLALKVVLADGSLIEMGHRTVKGVTGLDITALVIGSEGTLGIIVEATLKLLPITPGVPTTISAYFPSIIEAAAASAAITAAKLRPSVMELMDALCVQYVSSFLGLPQQAPGSAFLIVQTDGALAESEAEQALTIIQGVGGDATMTTDFAEGEELLRIRRAINPAIEAQGTALIEDVAVPRSALPAMFEAIDEISQKYGMPIPTLAHAGDGNLHPNFIFEGDEVPAHVWDAASELFNAAVKLGGTLTGEHGVGTLKKRWLADELGERQVTLQRQIKAVFDPNGILNPGKVFADEQIR